MKKEYNRGFFFLGPAIVIGVTALLGGTVAAAQVSLPDSPLYGIKTATEKVRVAVAVTDSAKAKTHLSIAKEKVREIEELTAKNASPKDLEKAEEAFADNQSEARGYIQRNNSNGSEVAQLNKNLEEIGARNQEVLNVVLSKVPEAAQAGIKNALERSQHTNATSTDNKLAGERGNATSSEARLNASGTSTDDSADSKSKKPEEKPEDARR